MILDIITLIRNGPMENPSYICAQMRRKAASSIATLAAQFPAIIHHQMKLCGFVNQGKWEQVIVNTLYDTRTRVAAEKITVCFAVTAMVPVIPTTVSTSPTKSIPPVVESTESNEEYDSLQSLDNEEESSLE